MVRDLELGGGRPRVLTTVEFSRGSLYRVQCMPYETWWWWSSWDKTQAGRVYPWLRKGSARTHPVARWRSIVLDATVRFSDWRRLFTEIHAGPKLQVLDDITESRCLTVTSMNNHELVHEWKLNRIQQVSVPSERCS